MSDESHDDKELRVSFYGSLRSLAGTRTRSIRVPVSGDGRPTAGELRAQVARELPALEPHLATTAVAVGTRVVPDDTRLDPAAEISLLPPVSGG